VDEGRTARFTGLENVLDDPSGVWGDTRIVYLQHASDPVSFFDFDLTLESPDWLKEGERGPDVSERMNWFPFVTMWQVAGDLPVAGGVPAGYGHLFTRAEYLSGWTGISAPEGWSDADNEQLTSFLAELDEKDS
ncbi:MAG: alpha/beta-hydrolase family protein, partial [Microthrixaceae bacterium]